MEAAKRKGRPVALMSHGPFWHLGICGCVRVFRFFKEGHLRVPTAQGQVAVPEGAGSPVLVGMVARGLACHLALRPSACCRATQVPSRFSHPLEKS